MSNQVSLKIDNREVTVDAGATILDAAKKLSIYIPTLCYHENLCATAACGICCVKVEGAPTPKRACCTPAENGMQVTSNSKELRAMRKQLLELILSNHNVDCPSCVANGRCELQNMVNEMGVESSNLDCILEPEAVDESSVSIVRDSSKCIHCGRCITVCNDIQTVYAIQMMDRGFDVNVNTFFKDGMANSSCVNCGQCTVFCPVGALREKTETDQVWDALLDPDKIVIVQEAPSIRVTLAEEFGMEVGSLTVGKMYSALKQLGFDYVLDTNFSADLTIMEEGTELVNRIKNNQPLPLITSCSPGWIKFMETYFADLADHVSSCKSPQQMFGALVKTYFAEKMGLDPARIVSVSIMPCTAKKFEARRPEMRASGYQDVDYVLTTRELARMIREKKIDFRNLPDEKSDKLMGAYTGAATIFGATGGVMEAAVRSAYFLVTGKNIPDLDVKAVRGMEGIKEATLNIEGLVVKVAVAHGLGNARKLLDKVKEQIARDGKSEYGFIEIMACPGGCVGGGGQPYLSNLAMRARRGLSLYSEDQSCTLRCSHDNPEVQAIYRDFLGGPGSHKAHELLHTGYWERSRVDGDCVREISNEH